MAAKKSGTNRKTIGVFAAQAGRVWGVEFLAGVQDAAIAHDINLICFIGGQPNAILTPGSLKPSYGIYDLAHPEQLSGIIMTADLGHGLKPSEIRQFCDNYAELPKVVNALEMSGIPNLLADNLNGMRSIIRHLIQEHGYKRIAFIRGIKDQVEAEQRFFAYKEELKANKISYDEALVVQGDYSPESGRAAVRTLLDERNVSFDAIAAANDRMALGAMELLQSRGMLVPGEVAVTGFDDVREARAFGVPLTTVRQSFYETGKKSLEMLIGILDGNKEPTQNTIPTEMVVRWSCGCLPQSLRRAEVKKEEVAQTGRLENKREAALREIVDASGVDSSVAGGLKICCAKTWDAFLNALQDSSGPEVFLNSVEETVLELQNLTDDPTNWHNLLSMFRRHALAGINEPEKTLRAENLFQQARMMISELSQRMQAYQRLELEQREETLQGFSFSMAPAMSLKDIGGAIQRNFANMGIDRTYVMFYDEIARPASATAIPTQQYHLFMQYEDGTLNLYDRDEPQISTGRLIPRNKLPTDRRYTSVVMPLTLAKNRFGFLWMEMGPRDWEVYNRVRNLMSSAFLRTMLAEQRESAQREVERLLDETKEQADEVKRLYQAEQERRQHAEALSKAARNLSTLLKLEQVPQQILTQLQMVLPYERGSLMMEEMDGTTRVMAHHGFPDDPRVNELRVQINRGGVYDQIAHSAEPIIIRDVTQAEGWTQVDWLPLNHSWMGVPLFSKNKVIGMLSLTRKDINAFSEDDLILASTFAMQAAIALENARLYEESQRFNELMERMVAQRVEELNSAYVTLEKLDKNKTSFIQVSAHELRTPITVMKGYLGMLRGNPAIQENEMLVQAVDGVLKGTDRLHQIVNAMLDVTKLENQTIVPNIEMTIVGLVIQLIQKEYKADLAERNISLTVDSAVSKLPPVMADPQLLQKALDAVMVNAIKFTPDGGKVTIEGEVVQDDRLGPCAEIRVRDTGIGIDPANHKIIFEKLFQLGKVELHSSGRTKFKGGGPGLGLAIAAGIMKAHHGKIWCESPAQDEEKLPGSTFFLRLPLPKS